MARGILSIFCASVLLVQTIRCQCLGNSFNGPYSGPIPEVGYPGPGFIGNNFGPDLPFGCGCYNPGFGNDIAFPGSGIYNPGFSNDIGFSGLGALNGFGPDCGPFPEIGFAGPGLYNPNLGPDYGVPCGGPIGPVFGDIGCGGPGFLSGLAPEIGFGPSFVSPNLPGPCPNVPCQNFPPTFSVAPNLPSLSQLNLDIPLGLPCQTVPQISPVFDPAPFSMPPTGMSIFSDDLIIEGPVIVTGRMPFLGAVTMEGAFTSAGAGAVSYGCGDGVVGVIEGPAVATVAPSFGFAPALPIGYGGYSGSGLGCANRAY